MSDEYRMDDPDVWVDYDYQPSPHQYEVCGTCAKVRTLQHHCELQAELDGAKAAIAHMTEAMSWISGHDRQGIDHLDDATQLASQLDAIRAAHVEYESALKRREHGAVAADRFIRAVAAVLDEPDVS